MDQRPEITAIKAVATTLDLPILRETANEIYISIANDVKLLLTADHDYYGDTPEFLYQLDLIVPDGRLSTDPVNLAGQLAEVLAKISDRLTTGWPR